MSLSEDARDLIFQTIEAWLTGAAAETKTDAATGKVPGSILADLDAVLADSRISYRDGVLIQLAYGLVAPDLNLTRRAAGARSVAQQLGVFLADHHIRHVKDAYQNIAKNTEVLTRGNFALFDRLLVWATAASVRDRRSVFERACAQVAATARPVLPMPDLDRGRLTFARTVGLLMDLLDTPSGGAFEQFTVAALLSVLVADTAPAYRVETKNLNASDRSSFAAGDVQIATGNRVIDAFEVTANDWRTKLIGVKKTIRDNDLSRLHVVAARPASDRTDVVRALEGLGEDVSVLDAKQVVEVMVAMLTRAQRAAALGRLHEYLDRYQSDVGRVNLFVQCLIDFDLVERGGK